MARRNYNAIMDHVFEFEGGYVDHPRDPGGATNMGITRATLEHWLGRHVTKQEVRDLSKDTARRIYRANYWNKVCGDELPGGLDLVAMDAAVNSGPSRGAKWIQQALGVSVDGAIGPVTIKAAMESDVPATIQKACDARRSFLRGLRTYDAFGRGWERRVNSVEHRAKEMALLEAGAEPQEPVSRPDPAERPAAMLAGLLSRIFGSM